MAPTKYKNFCRTGTETEDPMAVPRRVKLAAPHGVIYSGFSHAQRSYARNERKFAAQTRSDLNEQVPNAACDMICVVDKAAEDDEYLVVP